MFSVVAVAVPILILLLTRKGKRFVPAWAFRFPALKEIINAIASAPPEASKDPILLLRATALQIAIFVVDAATLDAALHAVGYPAPPDLVFASFSMASITATLSYIPAGLGVFEGSLLALLGVLGVPVEGGLTATLLMRGFTF